MAHPPASDVARHRAIKRHVWAASHRFLATCGLGVEGLLGDELAALPGIEAIAPRSGGVAFEGGVDAACAVLIRSRLAESLRVLVLGDAAAASYPMLHDHLERVRWTLWLPARFAGTVRVRTTKSRVRDVAGIERSLRQAWRDQGLDGHAADADPLTVHVRLHHDRASAALELGGDLHRREGGKWVTATTVRETTAAALVRLADVAAHDLVLDPFCGSGTLLAEADAGLRDLPARTGGVAFEGSPAWPAGRFAQALRDAHAARAARAGQASPGPTLVGRDADAAAVSVARRNLTDLATAPDLAVARAQELDLVAEAAARGAHRPLLLANPPYGRASAARGAAPDEVLAALLGRASGWTFAFLYPRPEAVAELPGVTLTDVRPVVTGGLRNAMIVGHVAADR